ncbi:unnamed protein product [Timema podura]|uniref:Uncharacterized protein n=1 Tax=Timema podura TaxID=61482 RepID=A0ABN7PCQ5_TIMPD|nr:unnamed protein product [Timema podura]
MESVSGPLSEVTNIETSGFNEEPTLENSFAYPPGITGKSTTKGLGLCIFTNSRLHPTIASNSAALFKTLNFATGEIKPKVKEVRKE